MSSSEKAAPSELIRAKDLIGIDVWTLPSFDPYVEVPEPEPVIEEPLESEEVPLEEVQPMTLEELESIRQDAYNEGFAIGEKEGFHSTQLKVRQEAEVALTAKLESLEQLMTHLLEPIADQDAQIEKSMIQLVEHIARQVIQRELKTDSSQIGTVLRDALKLLPMGASNVRILVNPQDFAQVKALRDRHEESWRILEDDTLAAGGCRVETEHSRIDASVETRISVAIAKMFDQLHEQALHPAASDVSVDLDAAIKSAEQSLAEKALAGQGASEEQLIKPDAADAS
jgi:flagellar assembly protein FliH